MNLRLYPASSVSYKQYLLFRTILPPITPPCQLDPQTLGIGHLMEQAKQILSDRKFTDYIVNATALQTQPNRAWEGNELFRLAANYQQQVIRDESLIGIDPGYILPVVRLPCLSFLQSMAMLAPQSAGSMWRLSRRTLTADFSTPQRSRRFVARAVGELVKTSSGRILALFDCKGSWRDSSAADMEEVAKMVAWVKQYPGGAGADQRVLVSKFGTEFYISVFQYDEGWLRYLNGGPGCVSQAGFAHMRRYGPWDIRYASAMSHFAHIIIALLFL
ncbi:hypothetical protein AbraIFM66951_000548 [Aspergillus brasiliensis]|uniref:Uncharacterized protein n=1 Tax=Aspergillus brasiliensis TaxID=319629 RepID=A0A9W6DS94_9EURO|nr:hypothetical protein AbraCBS73388_000662 [Aspergillus brasiliensis]GKZ48482.1 hypothetical protein AbraIFM66951_000548 [Aspergillus brasiliensis]